MNKFKKFIYFISKVLSNYLFRKPFIILRFIYLSILYIFRDIFSSHLKNKTLNYLTKSPFYIIYDRYSSIISGGMRNNLRICITYYCNASCNYCYARGLSENFPQNMTIDDFIYLVKWAKKLGWNQFVFLGGEPTCHPYFNEFINICYKEKIKIILFTNGLFNEDILKSLKNQCVEFIVFEYSYAQFNSYIQKKLFFNNLNYLKDNKIISISSIVDGITEIWKEVIEIAKYFNLSVRWSALSCGYNKTSYHENLFYSPRSYGKQLLKILKTSEERKITSCVIRPVPLCIFDLKEWREIRRLANEHIFTRCLLGFRGDYTLALTVNPDLSIYPCSTFFVKGPSIHKFKDRESINGYFSQIDRNILSIPSSDRCVDCNYFKNFKILLENEKLLYKKDRLFSNNICQGGCVGFKNTIFK